MQISTKPLTHAKPPIECGLCEVPIRDNFIEGMTLSGVFAQACLRCARVYRLDVGNGRGHHYQRQENGAYHLI